MTKNLPYLIETELNAFYNVMGMCANAQQVYMMAADTKGFIRGAWMFGNISTEEYDRLIDEIAKEIERVLNKIFSA